MSGQPNAIAGPEVIERLHKGCQTEDAWDDVQTLQENLKRSNEESSSLRQENEKLKLELAEMNRLLEEERADHAFARQELDRNAQRVLAMLGTPQSEHAGNLTNNARTNNFIKQDYFTDETSFQRAATASSSLNVIYNPRDKSLLISKLK